jgi:hypothetical protein
MKTAIIRLDGILAPPIWQQIAQVARIPDLVTSNEMWIVDNIALKKKRMSLLKQHGIKRDDLQFIVSMHSPYKGAAAFVKALRRDHRVIAVTNAPRQLAHHFTKILGSIELHSEFDACGSQSSLTDQANRLPSQRTIDANTGNRACSVRYAHAHAGDATLFVSPLEEYGAMGTRYSRCSTISSDARLATAGYVFPMAKCAISGRIGIGLCTVTAN